MLAAGLSAAALLGFAIRFACEPELREAPRRFVSPDCLYHMRRAVFAAAHFPRIPIFDPLIDFPKGAVGIWPPLFDVALALPARVLHGSGATREQVAAAASVVPPILGALAILAAGVFAERARRGAGIPVAIFVAVCGAHIQYSQYGHTDQHVAESLTSLAALALFLRARARPGPAAEIAAGAALGIAALTWQGAICWGALFALVLAIEAFRRPEGEIFRGAAFILGAAAAVDAAGVAFWIRGEAVPFTFISFGPFQPAFLLALAAGAIVVDGAILLFRGQWRPSAIRMTVAAAFLALVGGRASDLARNFAGGIGYVTRSSRGASAAGGLTSFPREMLRQIYEVRPLFADGSRLAWDVLSAAFFLSPIALAIWLGRAARGPRRALHLALAAWAALTLGLALSQRLNIYYAAPLAGLAGWETVRQVSVRIGRRLRMRSAGPMRLAAAVLLLATALPGLRRQLATRYAPGDDLVRTMEWARANLPHAVSAYDARFLPPMRPVPELARAEGMLSPWALGHFVTWDAELPAPADAFGYGFLDSIRFFLSESEDEALAIARARRARWVAVTDLTPKMNDYAMVLGRPPYLIPSARGMDAAPAYFRTMQSRLHDFDGAGPYPLSRFRLVHASSTGALRGGRFVAQWKIFEVVR
ncbi:MAG TPA: hypothetical protein VFL12_06155 [Thermoanaerobaculia bacterium]|nr:hypothetical protein [Thermoanaerobaculia bacterium]